MKTKLLLTAFVSSFILQTSAFAQGALTPPGAPAPTMKSLDQVEARTAITNTSSLVTISQPGSYYLTGNLTVASGNGININTNGVTLDLNGFTIRSTAAIAAGYGIALNGVLSDVTLCNGHIRGGVTNNGSGVYTGGGFAIGITWTSIPAVNVLVSRISVSGCSSVGINLFTGDSTVVETCTVHTCGSDGIYASTIKSCTATDCGGYAIRGDQVSDCRGESSSSLSGVFANTAHNCYGFSNSGIGLFAGSVAQNCFGQSNTGTGLYSDNASFCTAYRGGGTAIHAIIATGCYSQSGTNIITFKYNMP